MHHHAKSFLFQFYPNHPVTQGVKPTLIGDFVKSSSPGEVSVTFYTDINVGVNVGVKNDVNETQVQIMFLMSETPTISAQRIADAIGISKRRVESNIRAMKKAELIERVGSDKTGRWVVK